MNRRLPLSHGFGCRREVLWRVFGREQAVRSAWALLLLSEYRVLRLARYGVKPAIAELKPVGPPSPVFGNPEIDNIVLQVAQLYGDLVRQAGSAERAREFLVELARELSGSGASPRSLTGYEFRRLLVWFETAMGRRVERGVYPELRGREGEFAGVIVELASVLEKAGHLAEPGSYSVQDLQELASKLEPYLRVMGLEPPLYTVEYRDVEVPDPRVVEEEASRVAEVFKPLGTGGLEALRTLVFEGYKHGIAKSIGGLSAEVAEYLENLLDTPFKRVALVLAYEKLGGKLHEVVGKLHEEAFTYLTATPKAFTVAGADVRKVTG